MFLWKDDSEPSPIKNPNNSIMLEITNQDDYETFAYVKFKNHNNNFIFIEFRKCYRRRRWFIR